MAELDASPTPGIKSFKVNYFESCPADKTLVRILLVSGQKTDFLVSPTDTVESFCQSVYDEWPNGNAIHSDRMEK
jgi:hypothetical protein